MATTRDYKAIAGVIRQEYTKFGCTGEDGSAEKQAITDIALNIANYFEEVNSWFNKTTFLVACEFEE